MEIHILLTGRLGNQLFQYAFGKYLQKKYGGKIVLNLYDLNQRSGNRKSISNSAFQYDMTNFVLNSDVEFEDVRMPWYADLSNPIIRIAKKVTPKLLFRIMANRGFLLWQKPDYIEIPKLKSSCVFAHGYWQDIRYLSDIQKELQQMVFPINADNKKNYNLANHISKSESVCVSIRGGNYLNPKVKKSLFVCDRGYFIEAIKKICTTIDNPQFFVFSDDLKWVKEYICLEKEFPNLTFVYEDGTDDVSEKIRLMSMCKHYIISNSTFSWWAQYLGRYENKIVIAPNKWFTNGNRCGLYMDNWCLLEVD